MSYSELIHRYFDEGLEGSLEDVLFEQLARNEELRREFAEHARIASLVRADAAGLTPPAAVTSALFSDLGLAAAIPAAEASTTEAPAAAAPVSAARAARIPFGVRMRTQLHAWLPQFRTAAMASVATAVLVLLLLPRFGERTTTPADVAKDGTTMTRPDDATIATRSAPAAQSVQTSERIPAPAVDAPIVAEDRAALAEAETLPTGATADPAAAGGDPIPVYESVMWTAVTPANDRSSDIARYAAGSSATSRLGWLPMSDSVASRTLEAMRDPEELAAFSTIRARDNARASSASGFATPVPASGAMASSVQERVSASRFFVEMRVMNGSSDPAVDLPAPGNAIFRDMAVSAVYAVGMHHALGVEYGRESFGQVYASNEQRTPPSPSVRSIANVSAPWLPVVYNENRVLDWVGAVWKLSFADMALFDAVFPYARTVVGATKDGPLGKFRIGLEYAPWRHALFNAGFEGSLLRYSVQGAWYQTTKTGVTVGLAVGF